MALGIHHSHLQSHLHPEAWLFLAPALTLPVSGLSIGVAAAVVPHHTPIPHRARDTVLPSWRTEHTSPPFPLEN